MFARNVYKLMLRPAASEREVLWVMRLAILAVGALAAALAIGVGSVYGLWYLSSDLVYVILFPQLVCVVHFRSRCNTYGALCAYVVGLTLRGVGGEPILGLPALIHYPWFDAQNGQLFPFRTFAMLSSLATFLFVSWASERVFTRGWLPPEWDAFKCVVKVRNRRSPSKSINQRW